MNAATETSAALLGADSRLAYGVRELASMLGCSVELLRKEIGRKRLRPSRLGRRLVISRSEALRYLEAAQGR
jgi:excisionase family DNA binding protein